MDREIEELRQTRGGVEREIQESVTSLQCALDAVRAAHETDGDDRIRLLRPPTTNTETEPNASDTQQRIEGQS